MDSLWAGLFVFTLCTPSWPLAYRALTFPLTPVDSKSLYFDSEKGEPTFEYPLGQCRVRRPED